MLLIISMKGDFHIDYLMERMTEFQKENTIVFCTEEFPINTKIGLNLSSKESYIELSEKMIYLKNISSVWYRRPAKPVIDQAISDDDLREYAQKESQNILLGIWESMDCNWMSKPSVIENASHKWEQLLRAKNLGFSVPETLMTNNPEEASQFCRQVKKAVVKALRRSVFPRNNRYEIIYTTPIKYNDPRIADVVFSPCMFQEYVPKKIELRITVVNDQIFPCAIYSQVTKKTKDDWRNYDLKNTPHEIWQLPSEIEDKCFSLVKSYGLRFGAIDMILTPENEYVFLELNPNGQWVWIEDLTGMPISEAILEALF